MNRNVQSRYPRLCAIALVTALLFGTTAVARVTRVQITTVELVAGGMEFGRAGAYEKVRGTVFFEVNPADPHNAVVFDIDKAPRNARGNVEFSADFYVLRPVDLARGNHELFFEVNNRGKTRFAPRFDSGRKCERSDHAYRFRKRFPIASRIRDCVGGLGS